MIPISSTTPTTQVGLTSRFQTHLVLYIHTQKIRIDDIVARAWYFLVAGIAVASVVSIVSAVIFPSPFTITSAVVSSLFLSLFGAAEGMDRLNPYLSKRQQVLANFIQGIAKDILTLVTTTLLTPLDIMKYCIHDPKSKDRPVLYIHGYRSSPMTGIYYYYRSKCAGLGAFYTMQLEDHHGFDVRYYVKMVKKKIAEINRPDLVLIGHSMGGLIAMHCAKKVAGVVTLGSPLEGTTLANHKMATRYRGMDLRVQDMRPGSPLLTNLKEKVKKIKTPTLHIASRVDPIVRPSYSALFKSNIGSHVTRITFDNLGHTSFYFSDQVMDAVLLFIQKLPISTSV